MRVPGRRGGTVLSLVAFFSVSAFLVRLPIEAEKARQKAAALARLEQLGAFVECDYKWSGEGRSGAWLENAKPPGDKRLKALWGEYYASNPVEIQLFDDSRNKNSPFKMKSKEFTDEDAKLLSVFSEMDWLVLCDTSLTDEGLKHLRGMKKLGRLDVEGTAVTKRGAKELEAAISGLNVFYENQDDDAEDQQGDPVSDHVQVESVDGNEVESEKVEAEEAEREEVESGQILREAIERATNE
jgi:hypothetical protein